MHTLWNRQNPPLFNIVFLIAGLAWIWLSRLNPSDTIPQSIAAPAKGFQAPEFSLPTIQGEQVALKELRGHPVIINLWASWCTPCRAEMPALQNVYETYQDQGLEILAINATHQDDQGEAVKFAEELGLTFPILLDLSAEVSQLYRLQSLPTTYFVDNQGKIHEVVVGGPMSEALLRSRVEKLLQVSQP